MPCASRTPRRAQLISYAGGLLGLRPPVRPRQSSQAALRAFRARLAETDLALKYAGNVSPLSQRMI